MGIAQFVDTLGTVLAPRASGSLWPVLRQDLHIGEPALDASTAYLAGRTVLATELRFGEPGSPAPASGDWWSRTPPAAGGATALAHDVITAERSLATAWET